MPPVTKNLGLVRAIHEGVNPPLNIKMLWYNTNPSENRHYYYDTVGLAWKPLTGSGSGTPTVYTFTDSNTVDFNTSGNNVTASTKISPNSGNIIQALSNGLFARETLTALTGLTLTGQTLNAFYRDEKGDVTTRSVDLSSALVDVNVSNATFDPNTYVLTITETDGQTHSVNLSELIKINVMDSLSIDFTGDGTATTPLSGSVRVSPISDNILQVLSGGLYVPQPPKPENVTVPITLPELKIKIKPRTVRNSEGKHYLWRDEGGKAYDDILVSWTQEDKRFLQHNPKIFLFVYRNHKQSVSKTSEGREYKKQFKGYVHPSDKDREDGNYTHNMWGGNEHSFRGLGNAGQSVLDWGDYTDLTFNVTNKKTVFELSPDDKNYMPLLGFNHLEWFYLHHISKDQNGVYRKGSGPHFNFKESTPANLFNPYIKDYLKCITTHGGKNAKFDKIVKALNTPGSPKHRETVWFKFAIVCENPNPTNSYDKFIIGPMSDAVCLTYEQTQKNAGETSNIGYGRFKIHPEHRKIKWNIQNSKTLFTDYYHYVGQDGYTVFHDNWNNTDVDESYYPKVRYRRYGDKVRIDGCCWIDPKVGFINKYLPGETVQIFQGLQGNWQPEQDLMFNVPCLLDGGIEIVTVKIYAVNGSLSIINLPESSTFVLYLDGIEYFVGERPVLPA